MLTAVHPGGWKYHFSLLSTMVAVVAQMSLPTSPMLARGSMNKAWASDWALGRQAAGSRNI